MPPESPTVAEDSGAKCKLSMEEPESEESPVKMLVPAAAPVKTCCELYVVVCPMELISDRID